MAAMQAMQVQLLFPRSGDVRMQSNCPIKFHGEEGNFLWSIPTHNVRLNIKLEYKQVKDYELKNINWYYFEKNPYHFHTGGIGD